MPLLLYIKLKFSQSHSTSWSNEPGNTVVLSNNQTQVIHYICRWEIDFSTAGLSEVLFTFQTYLFVFLKNVIDCDGILSRSSPAPSLTAFYRQRLSKCVCFPFTNRWRNILNTNTKTLLFSADWVNQSRLMETHKLFLKLIALP